jgi:hypothetical protein
MIWPCQAYIFVISRQQLIAHAGELSHHATYTQIGTLYQQAASDCLDGNIGACVYEDLCDTGAVIKE